jgi:hypothetical protein
MRGCDNYQLRVNWEALILPCRAEGLVSFFGIKFLRIGDQALYRGGPCLYLVRPRPAPCPHAAPAGICEKGSRPPAHSPRLRPGLQSNHRSWADFFIDAYLSEGRAALMSRWGRVRMGCDAL